MFLAAGSVLSAESATRVEAQQPPSLQTNAAAINSGQDFTEPQNLFQTRYTFQSSPGSGSTPGTIRTVTSDTVTLRTDLMYRVAPQWTLALRGDLPFVAKDPVAPDNPAGDYRYGLGDADAQAALIKQIDARWSAGAGLRIVAPTGSDDLTTRKWQALPIVGASYMLPELSEGSFFTALVRYAVSFAGDPTARNISTLQLAPTLSIALPDRWFVTFYPSPDIRINYGGPVTGQTGRLFLPMDVMVGHSIAKGVVLSLEVGVPMISDYPVYDFKTVTRLNVKF